MVEPFQPKFNTWTARGTNKESVPITATIDLDPKAYRWPDVATSDAYAALASTCGGVDEKRDAVMVASISALADNNGFDTDAGVVVHFLNKDGLVGDPYSGEYAQFAPSRIEFAVGYTDPACSATKNSATLFGVGMNVTADPAGSSTGTWGPVPVLFIMRDYFGPTRPKANPQMSKFLQYAVFGVGNGAPYDPIYGGTGSDVMGIWNETETTGPGKKGEMPRGLIGPGGTYFRLDR